MKRSIELSQEKGASPWLTALLLVKHGFVLYKSDFHDAISIRYNWTLSRMPTDGVQYVDKASAYHTLWIVTPVAFPMKRHNKVRNITAELMTEVCYNVTKEPQL